jgi:DNA-binding YbaB/EbfC family protein
MAGYRGGYGGGFGGGNQMQNLIKQAQKMQEQVQKAQEELEEMEIEASAGGGLVKVIMNGKKEIKAINISPDAVDTDDMEMLEDLIIAAINDGYAKAEKATSEKLGPYAGMGMGL